MCVRVLCIYVRLDPIFTAGLCLTNTLNRQRESPGTIVKLKIIWPVEEFSVQLYIIIMMRPALGFVRITLTSHFLDCVCFTLPSPSLAVIMYIKYTGNNCFTCIIIIIIQSNFHHCARVTKKPKKCVNFT